MAAPLYIIFLWALVISDCSGTRVSNVVQREYGCRDTVVANISDTFVVRLKTPVATGFRWQLEGDLTHAVLKGTNPPQIIPDKADEDGGYGSQSFLFKVTKAGNTKLKFAFRRIFGGTTKYDDSCFVYLNSH